MSQEGYIFTIEGCPYAFSTAGIDNTVTPSHPEWADTWTILDGILVNPSEYLSWNERILPIEGDLEVDALQVRLYDKRVENILFYTPQYQQAGLATGQFSGNILTELFTRGTPRQNENYLQTTLVSASLSSAEINQELLLIEPDATSTAGFSPSGITGSLALPDPTSISLPGTYPIWVDDEAVRVVGVLPNNIAQLGVALGIESTAGRGLYGTRRKYHTVRADFKPELFLRHPTVVKRGVTLWRVQDTLNTSTSSIYPIWRGFVQSNPQTTDDGSQYVLSCNHKWQVYQNEPISYEGFNQSFGIKRNVYTPIACQVVYREQFPNRGIRTIRANLNHFQNSANSDPNIKFFNQVPDALVNRALNRAGTLPAIVEAIGYYAVGDRPYLQALPSGTQPGKFTVYYQSTEPDPGWMVIGVQICDNEPVWGNRVEDPDNNIEDRSAVYDFAVPEVAFEYINGDSSNVWPMISVNPRNRQLPRQYFNTSRGPSRLATTIHSVYIAEDSEANKKILFMPLPSQPESIRSNSLVRGNIILLDNNGLATQTEQGAIQFVKKAYELQSRLLLRAGPNVTTAESLLNVFFNSTSSALNLFNSVEPQDFDLTNRTQLRDWVTGLDNRGVDLIIGPDIKFGEYLKQYMKFYGYVFALKDSKIRLVPYDLDAEYSHTLTSSDFLEVPTLKQLPENIYNGLKIQTKNFETEYVFTDAQSKGRYKTGNTQELEIPNAFSGIRSPQAFVEYLTRFAKRFFSVWGYPQYLVKLKTSLSKINIDVGDTVRLSDYVVPDFSFTSPARGLSQITAFVIEKFVDLSTGVIEFSLVYQERNETRPYSPCIRVEDVALNTPVEGRTTITARNNFILPVNKFEQLTETEFSSADETSDYGASNRPSFQNRYGFSGEDGGVSAFTVNDAIEFILRDRITGATANVGAKVVSVNSATRTIVIDQLMDASFVSAVAAGRIVDMRFTDYDNASTQANQKNNWAWIGDTLRESLDNPPAVAPAPRTTPASQFSV